MVALVDFYNRLCHMIDPAYAVLYIGIFQYLKVPSLLGLFGSASLIYNYRENRAETCQMAPTGSLRSGPTLIVNDLNICISIYEKAYEKFETSYRCNNFMPEYKRSRCANDRHKGLLSCYVLGYILDRATVKKE